MTFDTWLSTPKSNCAFSRTISGFNQFCFYPAFKKVCRVKLSTGFAQQSCIRTCATVSVFFTPQLPVSPVVTICQWPVAYLGGGPRCDGPPPFGRTMKIFYRRLSTKRCVFCHFPARIAKFNNVWWSFAFPNFRKIGEFVVSIKHSEAKSVSASGGLCPLSPRPGALLLEPAGGGAPRPPL